MPNHKMKVIAVLLSALLVLPACSHQLQVKNMSLYQPELLGTIPSDLKVGIQYSSLAPGDERLLIQTINSLRTYGIQVVYPFATNEQSKKTVDYILRMNLTSQYDGSNTNFWINWPGFLIWTPAWHGYNYRVVYSFDVDITDAETNQALPRLRIPVDLDIRHAAMNRTWTEISWLEWSAIALIGGIIFTRYDNSVTPILLDHSERKIADYVGSKITNTLVSMSSMAPKITGSVPLGTEMKI